MVRRHLSEALGAAGRTKDAVVCSYEMTSEIGEETSRYREHLEWALGESSRMLSCPHSSDTFCQTSGRAPSRN